MIRSAFLVAIHDVTPAHHDRVGRIIELLDHAGINQHAMLVVPQWHGTWDITQHADFARLLRERAAAGAEVFLHGLRHDERGIPRSWHHHLRAYGRTRGEGEFMALSPVEAGMRLDRGLEMLRQTGLQPVGFVPPAWLPGRDWLRLLRERRLAFTESSWAVFDVMAGLRVRASAFCWSTRSRWHQAAGALIAATRLRVQARTPVLRVAIHPPDVEAPRVRDSLRRVLDALLAQRAAVSYRAVLSTLAHAA